MKRGNDNRVHVLFFTTSLGGGGAEKHLVRIANHLDRERFLVEIAVARSGGSYEPEVRAGTTLYSLETRRTPNATLPLRKLASKLQPNIICSVMDAVTAVAVGSQVGLREKAPVVGCVQVPPTIHMSRSGITGRGLRMLLPAVYRRTDQLVALSAGVAEDILRIEGRVRDRVTVIPNACTDARVQDLADEALPFPPGEGPVIMACGRLTPQKGFAYLIQALAIVRKQVPARLWLIGNGRLRAELESQVRDLGLGDQVWFGGFQTNPYAFMKRADVFVLSSLYEGFGNVIVEAMSVGTPVVSTACPYGPDEIIEPGVSGVLVPPGDPKALADGILGVLRDPAYATSLSAQGRRRALDFSSEEIAASYGELLWNVDRGKRL